MVRDGFFDPRFGMQGANQAPPPQNPMPQGPGRAKKFWAGVKKAASSAGRVMKKGASSTYNGGKYVLKGTGEAINNNQGRAVKMFIALVVLLLAWVFFGFIIGAIVLGILFLMFIFTRRVFKENPLAMLLLVLLVLGLVIFFAGPYILNNVKIIGSGTYESIIQNNAISGARISEWWKNWHPLDSWNAFWGRQVAIASGGYFEGQVEESKDDEKLGVYLEGIESADPILYEGDNGIFWVTVKGKAIDDPIPVVLNCKTNNGEHVNPEKDITIFTYEVDSYDCKINNFKAGTAKINFTADYKFKTLGYTKAYFIDQDKLRELRREDTDPLDEFGINDKNPIAIYTNGPVKIGMGTTMQPVAIKTDTNELSRLGITIENRWIGYVKKIDGVSVQVPSSMYLDNCDHTMEEVDSSVCISGCYDNEDCIADCGRYRFYQMSEDGKNLINEDLNSRIKFQTINCYLYGSNEDSILGSAPIATKYFRVVLDYEYVSEISKTVYIKRRPTTTTTTTTLA